MNDLTISVLILAATLGAVGFVSAQLNASRARRQQSLGDMYKPAAKDRRPPPASE